MPDKLAVVNPPPTEIGVAELRGLLDHKANVTLVDVREPEEENICRIKGARLIPMRTIPEHLAELEGIDGELIVFCHHGVRSLRVVEWLRGQGVANARSLAGGIDRWSLEIDPMVPRY